MLKLKSMPAVNSTRQIDLIQSFETSRSPAALFCHQDFLEKLAVHHHSAIGRRVMFLMQRLAVDASRLHYKATQGANRGWRRSRLGGSQGSHFYAWWAPRNAAAVKDEAGFADSPEGAVFLRDIRHHDDHSPLSAQSLNEHYLPVTVKELRREEYGPSPWTPQQVRFSSARQAVRLLKGHPGSGKTTALWHAADSTGAERVLYITYSRDLAALARDYFDRYCSSHKTFQVYTFPNLIRELAGASDAADPEPGRLRLARDMATLGRSLGAWSNSYAALHDELHAHLVGDALPIEIGRFAACQQPRVPDQSYRERRMRYLRPQVISSALETASRLERFAPSSLAERYFPELDLAWRAAQRLRAFTKDSPQSLKPEWLEFDCIAMDESQDLTPLEAFVVVELASLINRGRRAPIPLLLAGDEAQTVRPTDFEWGWLSDLLHSRVGSPTEYKLAANLRSPQRIAEVVNRVWDLYSVIEKQERPGGTGYAEIEDDATDQILYCTAVPGPDLDLLLRALSEREGLALITLEDTVPAFVPESVRPAVLTVREAKGLDFHSVCVIDAGRHIGRIGREDARSRADSDLEHLWKRLAIDQLRVALSRPTERLIWLDINPTENMVRSSIAFLNGPNPESEVFSCVPAALRKVIEENDLDLEERIQRCKEDARQYLQVKPEMAWSRAQQAITLLGVPGSPASVADEAARRSTYLMAAEICFVLAMRNTRLAAELGSPNLFAEAARAAAHAHRTGLATTINAVERIHRIDPGQRLSAIAELAKMLPRHKDDLEAWFLLEIAADARKWAETLEDAVAFGQNAGVLLQLLPPFYEALGLPDHVARTQHLRKRGIEALMKNKLFGPALEVLRSLPEPQPRMEAMCREGLGDFRAAAESYRTAGDLKEALNCYRSVPDLQSALTLLREIGDHPAAPSLEWMSRLQSVIAERPEKFAKVVTAAEKRFLEDLLEEGLGVKRRKSRSLKVAKENAKAKTQTPRKSARPKRARSPRLTS